jgi:hypothetical protein
MPETFAMSVPNQTSGCIEVFRFRMSTPYLALSAPILLSFALDRACSLGNCSLVFEI